MYINVCVCVSTPPPPTFWHLPTPLLTTLGIELVGVAGLGDAVVLGSRRGTRFHPEKMCNDLMSQHRLSLTNL